MFALGEDAPYVGLDWDDCRDPSTGMIAPAALEMIQFFGSYAEVSPSGTGVKMIILGTMPTEGGRGKNFRPGTTWDDGLGPIEYYRRGRFFALTGWHLAGTPTEIHDRSVKLQVLHSRLFPAKPKGFQSISGTVPDLDERARAARCEKYVGRMPASISGQGGHDRLLAAACVCWRFGLSNAAALDILAKFNSRCSPTWTEHEIQRKWSEAGKLGSGTFGSMLVDRHHVFRRPRRRTFLINVGGL
jgi:hypothetical protein